MSPAFAEREKERESESEREREREREKVQKGENEFVCEWNGLRKYNKKAISDSQVIRKYCLNCFLMNCGH